MVLLLLDERFSLASCCPKRMRSLMPNSLILAPSLPHLPSYLPFFPYSSSSASPTHISPSLIQSVHTGHIPCVELSLLFSSLKQVIDTIHQLATSPRKLSLIAPLLTGFDAQGLYSYSRQQLCPRKYPAWPVLLGTSGCCPRSLWESWRVLLSPSIVNAATAG